MIEKGFCHLCEKLHIKIANYYYYYHYHYYYYYYHYYYYYYNNYYYYYYFHYFYYHYCCYYYYYYYYYYYLLFIIFIKHAAIFNFTFITFSIPSQFVFFISSNSSKYFLGRFQVFFEKCI